MLAHRKCLGDLTHCRFVFGNNPSHAIGTYGMRRTVKETEHTYKTDVTNAIKIKLLEIIATLKNLDCKIHLINTALCVKK